MAALTLGTVLTPEPKQPTRESGLALPAGLERRKAKSPFIPIAITQEGTPYSLRDLARTLARRGLILGGYVGSGILA